MRTQTGSFRERPSATRIVELQTSDNIDDEYWALIEQISEVDEFCKDFFTRKGYIGLKKRKAINLFKSYVRQAKNFYYAAKSTPGRSSGLINYYCFMNLVKAALLTDNTAGPIITNLKHGLQRNKRVPQVFTKQSTLILKSRNTKSYIFPEFYKWRFGHLPQISSANILTLFGYCSAISYQYQSFAVGEAKIYPCHYAILLNESPQEYWPIVGLHINRNIISHSYKKSFVKFLSEFEEIVFPPELARQIFGLHAWELPSILFFQSRKTFPRVVGGGYQPQLCNKLVIDSLKGIFQVNYFSNDIDFYISLPYKMNNQAEMDENLAIYLIMFYLSDLVRYQPDYLGKLLDKKEAILIDYFLKFCPSTFIRFIISRILGYDYVIETR